MNFNAHKNNRFVKYGHLHAEYAANVVVSSEYYHKSNLVNFHLWMNE